MNKSEQPPSEEGLEATGTKPEEGTSADLHEQEGEAKEPKGKTPMQISNEAYRRYEEVHKRFEGGDAEVSEADVDAAYGEYLNDHGNTAGKEDYLPKSPHEKSFARRPEPDRDAWLARITKEREEREGR